MKFTSFIMSILLLFSVSNFAMAEDAAIPAASPAPVVAAAPAVTEPAKNEGVIKAAEVAPATEVIVKTDSPAEVSNEAFFASFANAFGQAKGLATIPLIILVVQLLIQFLKTPIFGQLFKKVDDGTKLAISLSLGVLVSIGGFMSQGMSFVAALSQGAVISAVMVAGHQIYLKFIKKDTTAA